jgi:hypothetical protein
MKVNKKIALQIALYYALYMVLFSWLFNPFTFLKSNHLIIDLSICFAVTFVTQWFILQFLYLRKSKKNWIGLSSFILTASTTFIILVLLNGIELKNTLFFYSSFFILSFFPSLLFYILNLYHKYEDKLVFEKQYSEEISVTDDIEIHIENENNKRILSAHIKQLICFEANDNYVNTYYLDKEGQVKKSMDRLSLKKIEDLLAHSNVTFNRIHKSYLINPKYLMEVKGRSQAYKLKMKYLDLEIPVSRNYDIALLR